MGSVATRLGLRPDLQEPCRPAWIELWGLPYFGCDGYLRQWLWILLLGLIGLDPGYSFKCSGPLRSTRKSNPDLGIIPGFAGSVSALPSRITRCGQRQHRRRLRRNARSRASASPALPQDVTPTVAVAVPAARQRDNLEDGIDFEGEGQGIGRLVTESGPGGGSLEQKKRTV